MKFTMKLAINAGVGLLVAVAVSFFSTGFWSGVGLAALVVVANVAGFIEGQIRAYAFLLKEDG